MAEPALKPVRATYEEYLAVEAASPERHIYWDGEILYAGTEDLDLA